MHNEKNEPAGHLRTAGSTDKQVNSTPEQTIATAPRSASDFAADYRFSDTQAAAALVRGACYRMVSGCVGVTRASPADDRAGVDFWVATPRGLLGLDLKLRRRDFAWGRSPEVDCVVEVESHGTNGWLLKSSSARLILFATADTGRYAMFDARALRTAVVLNLPRWIRSGQAREITTISQRDGRSWQSLAYAVNATILNDAIARLTDGAANDDGGDHGPR